jgi:hypothetical protein
MGPHKRLFRGEKRRSLLADRSTLVITCWRLSLQGCLVVAAAFAAQNSLA